MAGPRRALAIIGLLTVVLVACGGGSDPKPKPLNMANAVVAIRARAVNALESDSAVGRVRCPAKVDRAKGVTFVCTVEISGAPLRVVVRQTDDKSHVRIDLAQSVLVTEKMEEFVASYAAKQGRPASDVKCGEEAILVRAPGKKISCAVTLVDGTTTTATLGVKDTKGNTALISFGAGTG